MEREDVASGALTRSGDDRGRLYFRPCSRSPCVKRANQLPPQSASPSCEVAGRTRCPPNTKRKLRPTNPHLLALSSRSTGWYRSARETSCLPAVAGCCGHIRSTDLHARLPTLPLATARRRSNRWMRRLQFGCQRRLLRQAKRAHLEPVACHCSAARHSPRREQGRRRIPMLLPPANPRLF